MSLYNVEVFSNKFEYRRGSSCQTMESECKNDYLNVSNNKIKLARTNAEKGDYILITAEDVSYCGIVESCSMKKNVYVIEYKPFITLFDRNAYCNTTLLKTETLEKWLAELVKELYQKNEDSLQNITGLDVVATSGTSGAIMVLEKNIENLYNIFIKALISYGIVAKFKVDIQGKKLQLKIGKVEKPLFTIEADLPNILESEFINKKTKESINKLKIYNSENEIEYITYYLTKNGEVKEKPTENERIIPVIEDVIFVSFKPDANKVEKTFKTVTYEKAFSELTPEKYDNLIEIKVDNSDKLVRPKELEIGQEVRIIRKEETYNSILTGKEEKDTATKLIFGAIRLELTTILKRRLEKRN
ncbi:MAG: hypothetical protein RRY99_09545 [Flavobacterium sp.]